MPTHTKISEKDFYHFEQNGTVACANAMKYHLKVPESVKTEALKKGEYLSRKN